jgi:hypothetical protein
MTPQQLKDWAQAMGFTRPAQAAMAIHKSVASWSGYINGRKPIPDHVEELCRLKLQTRANGESK